MSRLKELDALRGIAALFVVLFHYTGISETNISFFKLGVTGVDLFFLISGYVILLTLEKTKTGRDFVISRLSRLYPSFIVMLLITLTLMYLFNRTSMASAREVLLNLTMMQPVFRVKNIDDSYWTLTVEMQFYFFMYLVYLAGKLKDIERIGAVLLLIIITYYFLAATFFENTRLYIIPRASVPILSHFQLFLAGITFYKMKTEGMTMYRHLIIVVCTLVTFYLYDKSGRSHFFIGLIPYAIMVCAYVLIFYLFVMGKLKFLNIKILTYLGAISYCLYLIHQEAGKIVFHYLTAVYGVDPFITILIILTLALLVSTIVTYYIERPSITYLRTKFIKPKSFDLVQSPVSKV